ncbi:MAG: hypothetical protein HKO90_03820 [Flavobacteriaceae bacterium]|nr:hypothetical protein [Flavobacteriaceae bacterium]
MKNLINILILTTILVFSCKNETSQTQEKETAQVEEEAPMELEVDFKFKTDKQDVFRVMMNNIEVDEIQKKNIHVFEDVIPTETTESMVMSFGPGNVSNNLIINLGAKEEKTIEIDYIMLTYGGQSQLVNASQLQDFFILNKFISQDEQGRLKTQTVDGRHNPTIIAKRKLIGQLVNPPKPAQ